MKINLGLWSISLLVTIMLSASLGLAYSKQDYNQIEHINPLPTEQNYIKYNPDLRADYSPIKSVDNNIEPASNLIIVPDPAKAAQYEANLYSQEMTKLNRKKVSPAAKNYANYEINRNGNPIFEPIKRITKTPAQLKVKTKNPPK